MKTMKSNLVLGASFCALLFSAGCAKENTSSEISASFKMTGSSSAATVANQKPKGLWSLLIESAYALVPSTLFDSAGGTVTLDNAWVVVKEIEFKSNEIDGQEDREVEISFQGPYVVDLLSNQPVVLDTQKISELGIRRIKMKFHKMDNLPSGTPTELLNNSIFLSGSAGGNQFAFIMDDSTELELNNPSSVTPGSNSEVLVEVQLANILKQMNLSSVADGEVITSSNRHAGSGLCPAISSSANDLYTCLRKGLEKYSEFGVDKDGDDSLDDEDKSDD